MSPSSPAAARSAARTAAPARRPVGPRRVSGPARPAERIQRPSVARAPAPTPFSQRFTRVVDHSLLDRLIRGRAWIGLVAFALIGIVAMQVTLLKLNSGIGNSIDRATALQRESSLLAAQVAELGSAERVQAKATQLGMVYAPPDDVRYLHVGTRDAARAASSFVAPATGTTGAPGLLPGSPGSTTSTSTDSTTSAALSTSPAVTTPTVSTTSTGSAVGSDATGSTTP